MPTLGTRVDRIDLEDMAADRTGVTAENLYLNQKSQTLVNARGVREGDVYELSYEPYTEPTAEELRTARFAEIELPENAPAERLTQAADEWAGDSDSDHERFQHLSRAVKEDAFFSHGLDDQAASLSGHGTSRLIAMLEDVGFDEDTPDAQPLGRIGDEEQFAALTAALARSIDIPARVVVGFEVPGGKEGTVEITGEDVTAWVEVAFEDIGGVRCDPAPDDADDPAAARGGGRAAAPGGPAAAPARRAAEPSARRDERRLREGGGPARAHLVGGLHGDRPDARRPAPARGARGAPGQGAPPRTPPHHRGAAGADRRRMAGDPRPDGGSGSPPRSAADPRRDGRAAGCRDPGDGRAAPGEPRGPCGVRAG